MTYKVSIFIGVEYQIYTPDFMTKSLGIIECQVFFKDLFYDLFHHSFRSYFYLFLVLFSPYRSFMTHFGSFCVINNCILRSFPEKQQNFEVFKNSHVIECLVIQGVTFYRGKVSKIYPFIIYSLSALYSFIFSQDFL